MKQEREVINESYEDISSSEQEHILNIFDKCKIPVEDSYTDYGDYSNEEFIVISGNANASSVRRLMNKLDELEDSMNIGYERESNRDNLYAYTYTFYHYGDED